MVNGGFAFDFWIKMDDFRNGTIFSSQVQEGTNIELVLTENETLEFKLTNLMDTVKLTSDSNRLNKHKAHHVAILVDADAGICYMLLDGSICDGGGKEIFGFNWISTSMNGMEVKDLSIKKFPGRIDNLRVYGQKMFTSQFIGNYSTEKNN
jgi:hypothetical protein